MANFTPLHPIIQHDFNPNFQSITSFSIHNSMASTPDFLPKLWENINYPLQFTNLNDQFSTEIDTMRHQSSFKKRKSEELIVTSLRNSHSPVSENQDFIGPKSGLGKSKSLKRKEKKPREVVHVRARRGEATDSHSIAERVRRGKINQKLECLQDIIPGCYKAMGMALMLDEIINYVQSLQNQVEFLSMKLAAASVLDGLNSQIDCIHGFQKVNAYDGQNVKMLMNNQGYDQAQVQGALAFFQSKYMALNLT